MPDKNGNAAGVPEIAELAHEMQRIAQGIDDNITFVPIEEGLEVKLNRPTRARVRALHELQIQSSCVSQAQKTKVCTEELWRPKGDEVMHGDHRKPVAITDDIGIDEYCMKVSAIIFADFEPDNPDDLDESEIRRALDFFLSKRLHSA